MKFPVRIRSRLSPSIIDPGAPIVSNNPAAPAIEGTKVGKEHKINPNALQAYLIKKSSNILYATRTCRQTFFCSNYLVNAIDMSHQP